jgi:hypothetical protein
MIKRKSLKVKQKTFKKQNKKQNKKKYYKKSRKQNTNKYRKRRNVKSRKKQRGGQPQDEYVGLLAADPPNRKDKRMAKLLEVTASQYQNYIGIYTDFLNMYKLDKNSPSNKINKYKLYKLYKNSPLNTNLENNRIPLKLYIYGLDERYYEKFFIPYIDELNTIDQDSSEKETYIDLSRDDKVSQYKSYVAEKLGQEKLNLKSI